MPSLIILAAVVFFKFKQFGYFRNAPRNFTLKSYKLNDLLLLCTVQLGLQDSVIYSAQPYGLPLNETILPQYLKQLGYATRIVGKVRGFVSFKHALLLLCKWACRTV